MSSLRPVSDGEESGSSSSPDFQADENELRTLANTRLRALLEDPTSEIPAGQLMAFVAKVGFNAQADKPELPRTQTNNIFAVLPGLPEERQKQILDGFQTQINSARKELPSGG